MSTENKDDIIIAMLEEIKSSMKNQRQPQIGLSTVEQLSEKMEHHIQQTADCTARMEKIMETGRKFFIREWKITIDILSKEVFFLLTGMGLVISVLGSALYFSTRPNYDRIDNDLKYRYILMKGEATFERISELENLFEIDRDNDKIRRMIDDVEDYERTVKEKAVLDEQNRRRVLESQQLDNKVKAFRNK